MVPSSVNRPKRARGWVATRRGVHVRASGPAALTVMAVTLTVLLAGVPGTASAVMPTIQIPGAASPAPPGGGVPDPTQAALAAAEAQLATLQAQIDPLAAQLKTLTRAVAKLSARLSATSDAVMRARTRLGFALSQVSDGAERGSFGLRVLLGIVAAERAGLSAAQTRADAARAAAAADPSLGDLFDASAALSSLQAQRDAVQAQIEDLLVTTRVTDTGASAPPGSVSIPYGDWAGAFLATTGLPDCANNRTVLVAWQVAESTDAAWNPLATTRDAPGASRFNTAGVKDYPTLDIGLGATAATLWGGYYRYGYGWIIYDLYTCASAATTAQAITDSAWCYGCAGGTYVVGVLPRVEANYEAYAAL